MAASQHTACPCHGCRTGGAHTGAAVQAINQMRKFATPVETPAVDREYAFEVRCAQRPKFGCPVDGTMSCVGGGC